MYLSWDSFMAAVCRWYLHNDGSFRKYLFKGNNYGLTSILELVTFVSLVLDYLALSMHYKDWGRDGFYYTSKYWFGKLSSSMTKHFYLEISTFLFFDTVLNTGLYIYFVYIDNQSHNKSKSIYIVLYIWMRIRTWIVGKLCTVMMNQSVHQ